MKLQLLEQGLSFDTKITFLGRLRGLSKHVPHVSTEGAELVNRSISLKHSGIAKTRASDEFSPRSGGMETIKHDLPIHEESSSPPTPLKPSETMVRTPFSPVKVVLSPRRALASSPKVGDRRRETFTEPPTTHQSTKRGVTTRCPGTGIVRTSIGDKKYEEAVQIEVLEKIFLGYGYLLTFMRMAEHSQVLKRVLRFVVGVYQQAQHQEVPQWTNIEDFINYLPENSFLQKYLNLDQHAYVRLDVLDCRASKLVNKFVLAEWTSWGKVHTVELSYTEVEDADVYAVLFTCGTHLISLHLKGCNKITEATMLNMMSHCKKLQHLGMWDANEETLKQLTQMKIPYLDLSSCKNISSGVMDLLSGQKYLDLSHTEGSGFDRKVLSKWARRNQGLQGLVLRRNTQSDETVPKILNDDCIVDILSIIGSSLKILDLTNCRTLTDTTVKAIANNCTNMQILKLNYSNVDIPNCKGENLRSLFMALRDLRELEIIKKVSSIENVDMVSEGLMNCSNLTALSIRHSKSMGDAGFSNVIKSLSPRLKKLDLTGIGDLAASQIMNCANLVELHLQGTDIAEATLNLIVDRCRQLVVVSFSGCAITDETMKLLLHNNKTAKRSLHSLLLTACNKLTAKTMSWICLHTDLRILKLSKCPWVTPSDLLQVARSCKRLHHLDITHTLGRRQDMDDINSPDGDPVIEMMQDLTELLPLATIETDYRKGKT